MSNIFISMRNKHLNHRVSWVL